MQRWIVQRWIGVGIAAVIAAWPGPGRADAPAGSKAAVDVDVHRDTDYDYEDPDPDDDGPEARDVEVSLSGSGRWNRGEGRVTDSHYSVTGAVEFYVTERLEPGIRQTIDWVNPPDEDAMTTGSTRIVLDYNFPIHRLRPFIGVGFGLAYGEGIDGVDNLLAPEAGIKFYFHERAFFQVTVELDAVFSSWSNLDEAWDDGAILSSIGIGYYW